MNHYQRVQQLRREYQQQVSFLATILDLTPGAIGAGLQRQMREAKPLPGIRAGLPQVHRSGLTGNLIPHAL